MQICVLVIASHNKPEYLAMEQLWLDRINNQMLPCCDVWLLHSKPASEWVGDLVNDFWSDPENIEVDITRRTIFVKQDECLIPGILAKTVKAIEFLFNQYDFIWRTNLSSVLDFDGLHQFCSSINNFGFYGGYIGNYGNGRFASGAGFLMSRDVAEYLVLNKDSLRWDLIDDVAIGLLLEPVFGLVHIERQWIQSINEPIILSDSNVFHYRCESYMHINTVAYMQNVIKYLHNI